MWIGDMHPSNWLSYLGVFFSIIAIYCLMNQNISLAMMAFIGAGVCDLFDGSLARRFQRTKEQEAFGFELDSLCDVVNFVMTPVIFILTVGHISWLKVIVAIIYTIAGVNRLAYFNRIERQSEGGDRPKFFTGLPVAYSALVLPILHLLFLNINNQVYSWLMMVAMLSLAGLFVWNYPIAKPDRKTYQLLVLLAILTLIGLGLSL